MAAKPVDPEYRWKRVQTLRRRQAEKFSRYFLLIILLGVTILFFRMVRMFLMPIILAAVFATLFYPVYQFLLRRLAGKRSLTAFLSCLLVLLCLLVPLYLVGNVVVHQAIQFYQSLEIMAKSAVSQGDGTAIGALRSSRWVRSLGLERLNWEAIAREVTGNVGKFVATVVGKTSGTAVQFVANIFIVLFIMFYFFRDGETLIPRIKYLIPLSDRYINELLLRLATVSRATIRGTVLIALIQSSIGALTLWIFGVPSPALWGVVMMVLAMIPLVGAWVVMHPAAIYQIVTGHVWQGIAIFLVTILVISTIDNILRPRLVGQYTGMHDLIIFFAALGGIKMFGPMGVIVGPLVASFFVSVLDIYSQEFKSQLDHHAKEREPSTARVVVKPDET